MKVAILSCGKSVGLFQQFRKPYDVTIGINDVVEDFSVDWWCFKDKNILADFTPRSRPKAICSNGSLDKGYYNEMMPGEGLTKRKFLPENVALIPHCTYRSVGDWEFNGMNGHGAKSADMWKRFTITAAFMLAYQLGATEIDVYGADMKGDENYAGRKGRRDTDRTEERWRLETEAWDCVVTWLTERGINVVRMTP